MLFPPRVIFPARNERVDTSVGSSFSLTRRDLGGITSGKSFGRREETLISRSNNICVVRGGKKGTRAKLQDGRRVREGNK